MPSVPFCDASEDEVLARVFYALVVYDHRHNPSAYIRPAAGLMDLARRLDAGGFPDVAEWAHVYYIEVVEGRKMRATRDGILRRARLGLVWRAVQFAGYKATRRWSPRVTNRGGPSTATKEGHE